MFLGFLGIFFWATVALVLLAIFANAAYVYAHACDWENKKTEKIFLAAIGGNLAVIAVMGLCAASDLSSRSWVWAGSDISLVVIFAGITLGIVRHDRIMTTRC